MGDLRRYIWILLVPLGFLTFHNLSKAGFVGDDYDQVSFNPVIRDLRNPFQFLTGSTFNSGGASELRGTYYKPAMTAMFALIYSAFGNSAFHFHIILVAVGILNSILLFFFLRAIFPPGLSWIGAAVFLVHPANSEVIQYISNYQDALFMTFGLAALNVELYRKNSSWRWTFLASALLLLSALSKETGLLFIPLMGAVGWWLKGQWRIWPLALSCAAYAYLRIFVSNVRSVQAHYTPMETADTLTRLINVPAALFYYLKNFFAPWPLSLAQHWIYREITLTGFVLPLIALAGALAFAYLSIRRFGKPAWVFAVWSILSFGLHSQLIPLDCTVADRWHYLPSIGMLGLILLWVQHYGSRARKIVMAATAAVIALFAGWTYQRNSHWENEEKLLSRDLTYQPDSFAIMSQLGYLWLNQNRTDQACEVLAVSVELAPNWWVNTNNYGVCLFQQGRIEEALMQFKKSIDNGRYHLAVENYAKILIQLKRPDAKSFLQAAVREFPQNLVLNQLLASVGGE